MRLFAILFVLIVLEWLVPGQVPDKFDFIWSVAVILAIVQDLAEIVK
jgi:hypothetical protein